MRKALLALGALVALAAATSVSATTGAAAPTPKQQLVAYLQATQPQVVAAGRASTQATSVLAAALRGQRSADLNQVIGEAARLRLIATRLAALRTPGDLREPHASLVTGVRKTADFQAAVANDLDFGRVQDALDRIRRVGPVLEKTLSHWRLEVTAKMRRFGLVVPFWVKRVGT